MFPYECEHCGGGYERCGSASCENEDCKGDQFCWEDDVVCQVTRAAKKSLDSDPKIGTVLLKGRYDGYGKVLFTRKTMKKIETGDKKITDNNPPTFACEECFDEDDEDDKSCERTICVKTWCKSCYENVHNSTIDKKISLS